MAAFEKEGLVMLEAAWSELQKRTVDGPLKCLARLKRIER